MIYTIYHVVGIKVGCTKDPVVRDIENRITYGQDIEIVVLEELSGDIQLASKREEHWAKELGYAVGPSYACAIAARQTAARRGGARSLESPHHNSKNPEHVKMLNDLGRKLMNVHTVVCPHCGLRGQARIMMRWHFSKCRHVGKRKDLTTSLQGA